MGKLSDYFAQSFPPKPAFRVADIPDLEGKVIIVTGMGIDFAGPQGGD